MSKLGIVLSSSREDFESFSDVNRKRKREAILAACESSSLDELISLADSTGGLLTDDLRHSAWPILLGCNNDLTKENGGQSNWQELPVHPDEEQVQRDVDRAFVYYPNDESEKSIETKKKKLYDLIIQTLRTYPMLCYFQGYHDIVQVLLLVLGENVAVSAVAYLSLLRIRDYMLPSLSPALKHLQLLPALLQSSDPNLAKHLSLTRPFFALSATLTLYAHDIQEYSDISRLYDFILAHEPVMTIYLFATIIISRRSELLDIPLDEPEMLHFTLSKLPQPLDLEALISKSLILFTTHPPEKLPGFIWWRLSSLSVLKTSRSLEKKQDIKTAQRLFLQQAAQLKRDEIFHKGIESLSRNRRPISYIATALLVGGFSFWLRRTGNDRYIWSVIWKAWESVS